MTKITARSCVPITCLPSLSCGLATTAAGWQWARSITTTITTSLMALVVLTFCKFHFFYVCIDVNWHPQGTVGKKVWHITSLISLYDILWCLYDGKWFYLYYHFKFLFPSCLILIMTDVLGWKDFNITNLCCQLFGSLERLLPKEISIFWVCTAAAPHMESGFRQLVFGVAAAGWVSPALALMAATKSARPCHHCSF